MKFHGLTLTMVVNSRLLEVKRGFHKDSIEATGLTVALTERQQIEAKRKFKEAERLLQNHFSR